MSSIAGNREALEGAIDRYVREHRADIINDLMELAHIPSVKGEPEAGAPYGRECLRALEKALELCRESGMTTENLDGRCGSALYGNEQNGEIGIVAHLDVVPAGDGWSGRPFEPYLRDGCVIGRGVRDNKNGAVVGMYAVRCIQALELKMKHAVRLIFGCAEETGMDDLPYYLKHRKAPDFSLVPDANFPVCHGEKGIYSADLLFPCTGELLELSGGTAANVVPSHAEAKIQGGSAPSGREGVAFQERDGDLAITAEGISAHASRPEGSVSAIARIASALCEVGGLSDSTRNSLELIRDLLSDSYGEHLGIAASDPDSGKLTCISGMISLEGNKIRLNFNIRYPVTYPDGSVITEGFRKYAQEHNIEFVPDDDDSPSYLPADHPAVLRLAKVYRDVTGKEAEPYVMGGGTYARHLPNAAAFGPDFPDLEIPCPEGKGDCHEPDECQPVDGLLDAVKIYVYALLELDAALS